MGNDILPFDKFTALVATLSGIGFILLLPLYLSLRRDVERLRAWLREEPEFATENLASSETALDKRELELERIYAERGEPVPGTEEFPALTAEAQLAGAAARVTSERPALERVTMERSALIPHPRWRRFLMRVQQPRWMAAIAAVALLTAGSAIVASDRLLSEEDGNGATGTGTAGITVAVLNSTGMGNAAGRTATQIEQAGFLSGTIGGIERESDQSVVMYGPGMQRAAKRVARELGGSIPLQALTREVQASGDGADVVVILGEDQAGG